MEEFKTVAVLAVAFILGIIVYGTPAIWIVEGVRRLWLSIRGPR